MKDALGHGSNGRNTKAMLKGRRLARQNAAAYTSADPYFAGDTARHAGKGPADNPHPHGSDEHADWNQGWREAEHISIPRG